MNLFYKQVLFVLTISTLSSNLRHDTRVESFELLRPVELSRVSENSTSDSRVETEGEAEAKSKNSFQVRKFRAVELVTQDIWNGDIF
jgi:hypothetical protein